jgi:hypothetical protein
MAIQDLGAASAWITLDGKALAKVAGYLDEGTTVVVVLEDLRRLAHVYRADGAPRMLGADEELTIPDMLGDFHVRIGRFFE